MDPHRSVVALVLAAGRSSRLGTPKQLVLWKGRPLLECVVAEVAAWPVHEVCVVLGAHSDEVVDAVDFGEATVLENPDWEEGIAASLRVGLDYVGRDARADTAIVALGDQPRIPSEVPAELLAALERSGRPAAVPKYRFQVGNPVALRRTLWPRLMALEGDAGASRLLRAHPDWVEEVWFDHLPPRDVDTPSDVADLTRDR
jgi:CTP:molybdopterin cytidylyltransferase MocA